MGSIANEEKHDALVVGTGFGGLYSLYLLKQLGLDVKAVESGADIGGTWYWNKYPGARSDVSSEVYRYSWDKDLLQTSPWGHNYLLQPEVQTYFQEIAKKHDLYRHIAFNSDLQEASWDETNNVWKATVSTGQTYIVRYLVTALGLTHKPYIPDIPNLESFSGQIIHTSNWNENVSWKGKKIAVIGAGASGVQLTSSLATEAGTLTQFIRHAQYVLPARYRAITPEERKDINSRYEDIWHNVFNSAVGFGFPEFINGPTLSTAPEEREKIFQNLWDQGSGFRFLFGGFSDLLVNEDANLEAVKFIHKKIREIVKDEDKVSALISHDFFARRPLTDDDYYARFNQDNVFAVDIKKTPIVKAVKEGLQTSDGKIHEFDLIVFATGFDGSDGSYYRVKFEGKGGKKLEDHWIGQGGPRTHLGVSTNGFPNLFFVNGPGIPFANVPPIAETGAEFTRDVIARAEEIRTAGKGSGVVESSSEAEENWLKKCVEVGNATLFAKTGSWFFGENVPGRKHSPRFFFGGINRWRDAIADDKANGYGAFDFGEKK